MKVLIHTDEYYPTAQACSYRMQVMADAFRKQGTEVTVVCSSANLENGNPEQRSEQIIYSPTIRMKKKTTVMRMLNNLSFGVTSVISSLKTGKVDLVITTSPPPLSSIPGWIIARLKGAILVYDVRDIWPDVAVEMGSFAEGSLYYNVFRFIANFMYKHADVITIVSSGKVKKIQEYVNDADRKHKSRPSLEKVWLVGNGYDTEVESFPINEELIQKYDLGKKFTCVYVGNIGLAQGLQVLLNVALDTRHKDVQFLIFGKGAEKEMLENLAREKKLDQVKFCGTLPHEDIYTLLKYSNLSFIPLKNANMKDSIPTKLYEALGIGCPVLLVAEGDACTVLDETKLGCHVSPAHPEQTVHVFDEMVDDYNSIIRYREHAQKIIHEKHTRQQIAHQFAVRVQKIINGEEAYND